MEEKLQPRLLTRESVVQAFPLVCNVLPQVTLKQWVGFARPHMMVGWQTMPRGLMTVQNDDGYILGLFSFEVRDDLTETRILWANNIIVPNIPGRDVVWATLVGAIDGLAKTNRCHAVRAGLADTLVRAGSDRRWVTTSLEKAGYSFDGVQGFRRLEVERR